MKRTLKALNLTLVISVAIILCSCGVMKKKTQVLPVAVSSMSAPISLDYLNLTKDSYQILKTETVESVVVYEEVGMGAKTIRISEQNKEFELDFKKNETTGSYDIKYSGIVKVGYLSAYDNDVDYYEPKPAAFAKGLAAYRLINSVQDQGADGIIEPIVTMKVGQEGKKIIFTTTITAKLIKIKSK